VYTNPCHVDIVLLIHFLISLKLNSSLLSLQSDGVILHSSN
jgi:hypothetical protein